MKFHNIRMVGPFNNEHLASLPTFDTSKDPGRMVWLNDGSLWYGETDRWVKILASDNGGNTRHNDLVGRDDNDCHPISAITGLEEALRYAGMRWELVDNTSWTVQDHVGYLVDTTGGAVTATLPAVSGMAPSASLGMVTEIVDMAGSFDSNEVTVVTPDNALIMGLNESLEIDTEWASATLVYSDSAHGWIVTDGKSGGCQGGGGLGGMQWNIVDANTSAQPFNGYFVDTETRSVRMTLSSTPEEGDIVKIIDYNGFAHTNNIIVDANGKKIAGSTNDLTLNVNNTALTLIYSDAEEGWVIESIYKDTGLQWNKINSNTNALAFNGYFVDTENTSVTLTLPTSPKQGTIIKVLDYNGFANTNNIFIDPNGDKINGDTSAFVMSVDRGSVTFIYSDSGEGWLIDNAYKTSETGGGIIDYNMTIYLAPDTAGDSPTGVVGSDITGDGSDTRPFFSIKRAYEYLKDYRIKVGNTVSIHGLPGKYHYTEQHAVVIDHRDSKFINIEFETWNNDYHFYQSVDTSVSYGVDTSNYDAATGTGYILLTFTMNGWETGNKGVQIGDYVRLHTGDGGNNPHERGIYNGYFLVTDVDNTNHEITIRYDYPGFMDSSVNTQLTTFQQYSMSITRFAAHVYLNITDTSLLKDGYFIYSEYGIGKIRMSSSSNSKNVSMFYVYDGVIPFYSVNLNGFNTGSYLINLLLKFYEGGWVDGYFPTFTNCNTALILDQSSVDVNRISINGCQEGFIVKNSSSVTFTSDLRITTIMNNKHYGFNLDNSICKSEVPYDYNGKILLGYNGVSMAVMNNSFMIGRGISILHAYYGMLLRSSSYRSFTDAAEDLSGKPQQEIGSCHTGIMAYEGSLLYTRNMKFTWCSTEAIYVVNSAYQNDGYVTTFQENYYDIHTLRSTAEIEKINSDNCHHDALLLTQSTVEVNDSTITDASLRGIYYLESQGRIVNVNVSDCDRGIYIKNSLVRMTNDGSHNVQSNSTYNIECYSNGEINIYTDNNITNTNPAANTAPSTSGYNSNNYIGMTVY